MNKQSQNVQPSRSQYVDQYRLNLRTALEISSDPEMTFLEPVNWPLIIRQLTQLVTDIGAVDAAVLLQELVDAIRGGALLDFDGEQVTPFDEVGFS